MSQVTNTSFGEAQERERRLGVSSKPELGGVLEVLRRGSQKNYNAIGHLEHTIPIQRIIELKAERKRSGQTYPMVANATPEVPQQFDVVESSQPFLEANQARAQVDSAYDTSRGEG